MNYILAFDAGPESYGRFYSIRMEIRSDARRKNGSIFPMKDIQVQWDLITKQTGPCLSAVLKIY